MCNMAKFQETFEHTADIGINASADSLGGLFEALAEGLADIIFVRGQVRQVQVCHIAVKSEDVEALAIDFLQKVLTLILTDRFLPAKISIVDIDENHLRAQLSGEHYDSLRHEFKTEVKAVTYHQLSVEKRADKWFARVIFDI